MTTTILTFIGILAIGWVAGLALGSLAIWCGQNDQPERALRAVWGGVTALPRFARGWMLLIPAAVFAVLLSTCAQADTKQDERHTSPTCFFALEHYLPGVQRELCRAEQEKRDGKRLLEQAAQQVIGALLWVMPSDDALAHREVEGYEHSHSGVIVAGTRGSRVCTLVDGGQSLHDCKNIRAGSHQHFDPYTDGCDPTPRGHSSDAYPTHVCSVSSPNHSPHKNDHPPKAQRPDDSPRGGVVGAIVGLAGGAFVLSQIGIPVLAAIDYNDGIATYRAGYEGSNFSLFASGGEDGVSGYDARIWYGDFAMTANGDLQGGVSYTAGIDWRRYHFSLSGSEQGVARVGVDWTYKFGGVE